MKRFFISAAVSIVAVVGASAQAAEYRRGPPEHQSIRAGETLVGELTPGDSVDAVDKSHFDDYRIYIYSGQCIEATLRSGAFDSYLSILGPDGRRLSDDDGGGKQDAELRYCPQRGGEYTIRANSYAPASFGSYQLSVRNWTRPSPTVYEVETYDERDFVLDPVSSPRMRKGQRELTCPLTARSRSQEKLNLDEEQLYNLHRFTAKAGDEFIVQVFTDGDQSAPLDPFLEVFPEDGATPPSCNDDRDGRVDPRIVYRATQDGAQLIRVSGRLESDSGPYRLAVAKLPAVSDPSRVKTVRSKGSDQGFFSTRSPRDAVTGAPFKEYKLRGKAGDTYAFTYSVDILFPKIEVRAVTAGGQSVLDSTSCPSDPPNPSAGTSDLCSMRVPPNTMNTVRHEFTFARKGEVRIRATTVSPVGVGAYQYNLQVERIR